MAITWQDLLTEVRVDLKDPSGSKWDDSTLYVWLKDAVRDYSTYFPYRVDRAELTASDTENKVYTLPAEFVDTIYVESPKGTYLEERNPRPGARYADTPSPYTFVTDGGSLILSGPPSTGDSVWMTFHAVHLLPTGPEETTFTLTVPDADIELIRIYMVAKAQTQYRGNQARLDRFKETGRRDDNPLEDEVIYTMDDYYRKIASRFKGGVVKLYRPGRVR